MAKANPFNDNLAFQPKGTDLDARIKVEQALSVIREYCFEGGHQRDAQAALAYIEDHCPKTEAICDEIRTAFLLDDVTQGELWRRICERGYNKLLSRINNKSV